jgi:serine protease Do
MNRQAGAFIGLTAVVSFLLGLVAAGTRSGQTDDQPRLNRGAEIQPLRLSAGATGVDLPTSVAGGVDFAAVAETMNAAVVNVDTAFRGSYEAPRFARRYSTEDQGAPREGTGSGFIVDPDGYILTNYHVVNGADRVTVTLSDQRAFRADVIGIDPALDVALLKVEAGAPLPAAVLGDSDRLRVGEWVCAIGNPLGVYVHSVTVGVVSFLGRKLFDESLDAYIQTDAAISVGNSGGPLINARGEVVGITTAVVAQAMNIGFAIPITQVIAVLPQLRAAGMVARGDLGVAVTTVTPELRRALDLGPKAGALVQDVLEDTPADRAGLRAYDVIVALDGLPVESDRQLLRDVANRIPGTVAELGIWRDGTTRTANVKLSVRQVSNAARRQAGRAGGVRPAAQDQAPLGISVRDLDDETAQHLRIPPMIHGVLVTEVDPAGPARLAQVRGNMVILELNREPVRSKAAFRALASALGPGDVAALLVYDRTTRQRVICPVVVDAFDARP